MCFLWIQMIFIRHLSRLQIFPLSTKVILIISTYDPLPEFYSQIFICFTKSCPPKYLKQLQMRKRIPLPDVFASWKNCGNCSIECPLCCLLFICALHPKFYILLLDAFCLKMLIRKVTPSFLHWKILLLLLFLLFIVDIFYCGPFIINLLLPFIFLLGM